MNAADLPATLGKELKRRKYFVRMETLEHLARGRRGETTIYFTMSTWDPYTVVLMKASLQRRGR